MPNNEPPPDKRSSRIRRAGQENLQGSPPTPAPRIESDGAAPLSEDGTELQRPGTLAFPIVGIGASAGGLEACTQLLRALPADTGMAVVLVQHLSPDYQSQLVELLAKVSSLSVTTAEEGVAVTPNRVYVIPPNAYLTITYGVLHLVPRGEIPGPYIPIDHFLRALAHDQQTTAIAVILSGTGSDGALGVEAIKAEGGITFAQEEASAHYPGMPHSAIATGSVDFILPPVGIAQALSDLKTHPYLRSVSPLIADSLSAAPDIYEQILVLLKTACGTDFRLYRQASLKRRILRRLALHHIETLEDYLERLRHDPAEVQALHQDILIRVTAFFRNREVFAALQDSVFPQLLGRAPPTPIRIWVPGCATGEEAYSLAICLMESLAAREMHLPIQIFGTDVNEEAIAKARAGIYIENIAMDVSPERLRRFFVPTEKGYRVCKALRDVCIFARQDITQDPPFSNLDLVSCRNVLIYVELELQKRLLSLFHYALKPAGFLLLGSSESAIAAEDLFAVHDAKSKIYSKQGTTLPVSYHFTRREMATALVDVPQSRSPRTAGEEAGGVQQQADRLVLAAYAPPGVILNREFEIVHFRGDTSPFLAPAPGKASFHILKMAREGFLMELRAALAEASQDGEPVIKAGLQVVRDGHSYPVTLRVLPFAASSGDRYFLVLFEETSAPASAPRGALRRGRRNRRTSDTLAEENARLQRELVATREYLQTMIEEREAANEELQAVHEEALSTNEELQSINEELETAKEELQSSNEELTTLNEELQNRNATLAQVSNDLTNLLTVIDIAVLIVDRELRIRRFTPAMESLLNLLPSDMGRPLTDLRPSVQVPDFERLILTVIQTLTPVQREVQGQEQQWYMLTIRPYQTENNQIDGAVITFTDINLLKESELRYRQLYEQGFATAQDAMALIEAETGYIIEVNPRFTSLLGWTSDELSGKPVWDALVFHPILENEAAFRLSIGLGYRRFEDLALTTKEGQHVDVDLVSMLYPAGSKDVIQVSLHDLTERKQAAERLRVTNQSLVRSNEDLRQFAYAASHDLREPLRQVSLYAQLLSTKYQGQLDTAASQYLASCVQGTQRMQALLQDLLAYVQAGEAAGEPPPIDCQAVLQQALQNLQAAIVESGAVIRADPLPTLHVHEVHLLQVFQNLLSNALKYRGEHTPTIQVSAMRQDGAWVFAVRDNGIGIDPQYHTRIFGIFKRLHGEQYEGTGMGLAICHKIVEHYGGRIWVESVVGKGATFFFTLGKETGS